MRDPYMTPLRALNDACRALCGESATRTGRHDDACLVLSEASTRPTNDELGRCHECGHWRVTYCNADGFHYCDTHYPEGLR